jgi:transposase-like protein
VEEQYPRNQLELEAMFSTEDACREYLVRLRWPEGFICPRCGKSSETWPIRKTLFQCTGCKYQASVTAGTIFQDTRTPLTVWFRAMWWVTTQKNGASAIGLQRVLGLKSYETAWTWLHKFRRAMVRPGRELLNGRVEVDECYIGAPENEMRGSVDNKTLVVVAVEENGKGIGRIRLKQISDASGSTLNRFLQDSVAAGSVVHTDGWRGYRKVSSIGYEHEVTVLKGKKKEAASELLPRVHLVISLLKRWLRL